MSRSLASTELLPAVSTQPAYSVEPSETEVSYHSSAAEDEPSAYPPTAHVRPTHPLKSFAVPTVTPHATFESPALPSTPLLSQTGNPLNFPQGK